MFMFGAGRPPGLFEPKIVHGAAPEPPSHTTPSESVVVWLPEWKTAAHTVSPSVASARGVSPKRVTIVSGTPSSEAPRASASKTHTSARPTPAVVS